MALFFFIEDLLQPPLAQRDFGSRRLVRVFLERVEDQNASCRARVIKRPVGSGGVLDAKVRDANCYLADWLLKGAWRASCLAAIPKLPCRANVSPRAGML